MHVQENTPERLVLAESPWPLGLLLGLLLVADVAFLYFRGGAGGPPRFIALVGLVLIAAFFALGVRRFRLSLDRTSGRAELRIRALVGARDQSFALDDLVGAIVEERVGYDDDRGRSGRSVTRRAVLRLRGGQDLPLSLAATSGGGSARTAAAINGWLAARRG